MAQLLRALAVLVEHQVGPQHPCDSLHISSFRGLNTFSSLYGYQAQIRCAHTYMLADTHAKQTNKTNTNSKAKQRPKAKQRRFIYASQNNTTPGL